MSQPYPLVTRRGGPVFRIAIDRPELRNALNEAVALAIEAAPDAAEADDGRARSCRPR